MMEPEDPVISEYLRVFEQIECLGSGGFGDVFKAKKKIDGKMYAVKRINTEGAMDWALREVKALAELDHHNIVRYYHAWIEHPPKGQIGSMSSTGDDPSSGPSATDEAKEDSLEIVFEGSSNSNNPPGGLSVDGLDSSSELTGSRSSSIIHSNDENTGDGVELGEEAEVSGSSQAFLFIQQELCQKWTLGEWLTSRSEGLVVWRKIRTSMENTLRSPTNLLTSLEKTLESLENTKWLGSSVEDEKKHRRLTSMKDRLGGFIIFLRSIKDTDEAEWLRSKVYLKLVRSVNKDWLRSVKVMEDLRVLEDTAWFRTSGTGKRSGSEGLRSIELVIMLKKNRALRLILNIFSQIVDGVEYIHSKNHIHRDLKPSNIFLAEGSDVVKIGDLGLAKKLVVDANPSSGSGGGQTGAKKGLTRGVGTKLYMSPELERSNLYDYKVDIYSLGVIFFELLNPLGTGMERVTVLSQLKKAKDDKDRFPPSFVEDYPEEHSMIVKMVSHDPTLRPDATSIREWVKERLNTLELQGVRLKAWNQPTTTPASAGGTDNLLPQTIKG